MSKKNVQKAYRLLVVAHPDDETLFFASAVMQQKELPWTIICVTDGNADAKGVARSVQFKQACKKLNASQSIQWDFPDVYEKRLDITKLTDKLIALPKPREIYTHGPVGEYGHPHHQDVSFAVHSVFAKKHKIWIPAYNCSADKIFRLSESQYRIKSKVYAEVYAGETLRFAEFIPNRNVDEFTTVDLAEASEIYSSIIEKREPNINKLKKYKWFHSFLKAKVKGDSKRPF